MFDDLWPKPPRDIQCPKCGASVAIRKDRNSQVRSKPFCKQCGWNVYRARRDILSQMGFLALTAIFSAIYVWAIMDFPAAILVVPAFMVMTTGLPLLARLHDLPKCPSAISVTPLGGYVDVQTIPLGVVAPRLNVIFEAIVVIAMSAALLYIPRELDPSRRTIPRVQHEFVFVILTMAFSTYQLAVHSVALYRFIRSIWTEQHLVSRSMIAKGRVTDSKSGNIQYEFLDYSNQIRHGAGRDYTLAIYEDMPLNVLYDPENPWLSLPLVGLQFHRPREM